MKFSKKKTSLEIIKEIKEFSSVYIEISQAEDKHIYCLRYLRHKIYWNSILTTAKFVNYKHFDKLKELLVAYYYQNWIAGATRARIKQTSFKVLEEIKECSDIQIIKERLVSNLNYYNTTKSFKEEINNENVYGRKWDKAVLLLIEYFMTDNSKENFIPLANNLHLEHILPQNSEKWNGIFTEEELQKWTNSLANLTLLSLKKNVQASNEPFATKKKVYKNKDNVKTSFEITSEILKEEQWNVQTLEKRKERLWKMINKKINLFE